MECELQQLYLWCVNLHVCVYVWYCYFIFTHFALGSGVSDPQQIVCYDGWMFVTSVVMLFDCFVTSGFYSLRGHDWFLGSSMLVRDLSLFLVCLDVWDCWCTWHKGYTHDAVARVKMTKWSVMNCWFYFIYEKVRLYWESGWRTNIHWSIADREVRRTWGN